MAQAESPLSLEAAAAKEDGKPVVVARLRNRSEKTVVVVLDDFFCQIETQLTDEKGKVLVPHDLRAVRGMQLRPTSVKPATLKPGEAAEVRTFSIVVDHSNAMAGELSWELQNVAGQTLKVSFTVSFPPEKLAQVDKIGGAGAVAGDWTSLKVDVPTSKLTQKQVNNILSGRRRFLDAGVTPLLIQALDKASGEVVREWAAVSLGDIKAAAGAAPLARLLLQDPARAVRLSAATALGEIAAPESREALTQAARQDSDSLVRSRSEDALAKLPR
jgi:hypothetical protein